MIVIPVAARFADLVTGGDKRQQTLIGPEWGLRCLCVDARVMPATFDGRYLFVILGNFPVEAIVPFRATIDWGNQEAIDARACLTIDLWGEPDPHPDRYAQAEGYRDAADLLRDLRAHHGTGAARLHGLLVRWNHEDPK